MKNNFRQEVYRIVRKIPKGKVATYGQVAIMLGRSRGGREVGWMLHSNDDLIVPCHRVVDRNGRLAPNFGGPSLRSYGAPSKFQRSGAFDGFLEQKRRLLAEGVQFKDEKHVNLAKYLWQENSKF